MSDIDATAAPAPEPRKRAPLVPWIRILRVLWRMVAPFAVAANIVAWTHLLGGSDELKHQSLVTGLFILGFSLVASLIQEVLSPSNAELRLVDLKDHQAARMMTIVRGLLFTLLGTELAIWLVEANGWNPSIAALLALVRTCGLIVFGWAAISRSWIIRKLTPETTDTYWDVARAVIVRVILPLALLTTLFVVIVHSLGYEALAYWAATHAGWTAALLVGAVLLHRWLRRRLHAMVGFLRDERTADEEAGPSPVWIGLERIFAGALRLGMILAVGFIFLRIWGLSPAQFSRFMDVPIFGTVGGNTWGSLLGSFLTAFLVFLGYRLLQNILIFFVFPRTGVELGARYAMLTVLRYGAVVVIGLLILGALGVGTSTLGGVAAGASVGLAFGMKDIFSNFFSGLIMLLERPVRVGDTVEVGGTKGKIEAVRLRGTTIRTFDGTVVIVPNTDMIGSRLANLTHGFETARMQVDVGVAYSEDPKQVEKILLEIAHADERVLKDPSPVVRFANFGGSSLDFSLRIWTQDLDNRWAMVSDMRTAIFEAFKKAEIEIPFPQMDLHVRSGLPAPERPPEA